MSIKTPGSALSESAWFKSSYSGGAGGECVEVAAAGGSVHVRDSKVTAGPVIAVAPEAWAGFIGMAVGTLD